MEKNIEQENVENWNDEAVYKLVGDIVKVSLKDLFRMPIIEKKKKEKIRGNSSISINRNQAIYFFKSDLFKESKLNYNYLIEKYSSTNKEKIVDNYLHLAKAYDSLAREYNSILEELGTTTYKFEKLITFLTSVLIFKVKKNKVFINTVEEFDNGKEIKLIEKNIIYQELEDDELKAIIKELLIKKDKEQE